MSSFEEETLYQLEYGDFLDSKYSTAQSPFVQHEDDRDHTKYYILQEILESGTSAETDILGSVLKLVVRKKLVDGDAEKSTNMNKWLVNKLKKDGYKACVCHTSWPTTSSCPAGDYECIDILHESRNAVKRRVIVDTDFKSQFELARHTPNYKELFDILPSIFVGDEQKLDRIISILCDEAVDSFRQRGLYVPPWRTPCYMHSKWFSSPSSSSSHEMPSSTVFPNNQDGAVKVGFVNPSSKLTSRVRCGLSSQFSAMTTKCS